MIDPQAEPIKIIKTVLSRLPLYYNFLLEKRKEDYKYISSTVIAKSLKLNNIQVRKDLACVSKQSGKPRMGFEIESLINDIEEVLGFNNLDEVVLVGAGRLGRTLLKELLSDAYSHWPYPIHSAKPLSKEGASIQPSPNHHSL